MLKINKEKLIKERNILYKKSGDNPRRHPYINMAYTASIITIDAILRSLEDE